MKGKSGGVAINWLYDRKREAMKTRFYRGI